MFKRIVTANLVLVLSVTISGCTHVEGLTVASNAPVVSRNKSAAVVSDGGVQLVIRPGAWFANPPNLSDSVLPLHVTLENHSTHTVDTRHALFVLRGPALDYHPLEPPALVQKVVTVRNDPLYVLKPDSQTWMRTGGKDGQLAAVTPNDGSPPVFMPHYVTSTVTLPTIDMIDRALPRKDLEPGETVSGFLFYERPPSTISTMRFTLDLIDRNTGLTFGRLVVPLTWHGHTERLQNQ
jgi:hypothetical protein